MSEAVVVPVVVDGKELLVKTSSVPVTVHNETTVPLFAAVYFSRLLGRRKTLWRLDTPVLLRPGDTKVFKRPSKKSKSHGNSTLFFSTNDANLKPTILRELMDRISHKNVAIDAEVFIGLEDGFLVGRNALGRSFGAGVRSTQNAFHRSSEAVREKLRSADVKIIRSLSVKEDLTGLAARCATVEEAMELLGQEGQADVPESLLGQGPGRGRCSAEVLGQGQLFDVEELPMRLGEKEQTVLDLRRKERQAALERYLKMEDGSLADTKLPNVSLCFSGGGYRALIATLGAMRSVIDSGLLDCVDYCASLSGSCWALGMLYASGSQPADLERVISSAKEKLQQRPTELALTGPARAWHNVVKKERTAYGLPVSRGIDIYATMLAAQLFSDVLPDGFRYPFSQLRHSAQLRKGNWPIPLFTSVFIEPHGYEWLELTPWEVGGEYMGAYIPVETFGSNYVNGVLTKQVPEIRLGTVMAVTTSAFCLTLKRLMHEIFMTFDPPTQENRTAEGREMDNFAEVGEKPAKSLEKEEKCEEREEEEEEEGEEEFVIVDGGVGDATLMAVAKEDAPEASGLQRVVERTLNSSWLGDQYLFKPATFSNFTYGMAGSATKRRKELQLFDGGNDFCLPLPALLRRAREQHVIICVEMSSPPDIDEAKALRGAVRWAKQHGYRLPEVAWKQVELYHAESRIICVFEDEEDVSVPTLVYITLQYNPDFDLVFDPVANAREGGFCSTGNLRFAPAEFDQLADLMAFTMAQAEEQIRSAIRVALGKLNR